MGMIHDLATLVGAGANWDDILAMSKLEKGGVTDVPEPKGTGEIEETKPIDAKSETPGEETKEVKPSEPSVDIEGLMKRLEEQEKALADANKKVQELQEINRTKNLDDGSHVSDEDALNNIMMEMF